MDSSAQHGTRSPESVPPAGTLGLPGEVFDVDATRINRCPKCKTPWSVGHVAAGTVLEIECRRKKQCGHKFVVRFT